MSGLVGGFAGLVFSEWTIEHDMRADMLVPTLGALSDKLGSATGL
jgi:hypothetical protein